MADEKEDGLKLFSPSEEAKTPEAAKFIPENEGKNGISPISVDHLKAKFTGLTKEELMKFANDPFWVRLRWFLFITFWLIWFLMLFAAIFIIVVSPKCQEPTPSVWWTRSPLYVLDVKKLVPNPQPDTVIIKLLKEKISYMKEELGIESLLLKSVMESNLGSSDEVKNFTNVDSILESLHSFQHDVIEFAKSKGVHIMLAFSPDYSSKELDQFVRSVLKENSFTDFYVWHPDIHNGTTKPSTPPNNWLSVYDTPAWEWDDHRKQFYLHQFHAAQPELNYRNPAVVEFMSSVLKFWLDLGVQGFHLNKTEYLLEDNKFLNESVRNPGSGAHITQYSFYYHTRTYELPENVEILGKWSEIIRNASGVVSVSGGILDKKETADMVLRPLTLTDNFTAIDLEKAIKGWKNSFTHPTWEWNCSTPTSKCHHDSDGNCFTIVSFLLPGVPVIYDSDEFKASNGSTKSAGDNLANKTQTNSSRVPENRSNLISALNKLREKPALSFGDLETFNSGSVFAFTRIKAGYPGYLVAWNLANKTATINFQDFIKTKPEQLSVGIKSSHSSEDSYKPDGQVSSNAVDIPAKSAVVFSFINSSK